MSSDISPDDLDIILKVCKRLAPKFTFGYYDVGDVEQEAFIIALEGLKEYDGRRPLENFLSVHVRNRLINFKRDNYCRPSSDGDSEQVKRKREMKKFLMEPLNLHNIQDERESNMRASYDLVEDLEYDEVLSLIDRHLPGELRPDYLRMRDGVTVPKHRRQKVYNAITEILHEYNYETRSSD